MTFQKKTKRTTHIWRYVSVVLVLITVFTLSKGGSNPKGSPNVKTYTTAPGQRAKVTLPSGVQISLAPASRLNVIDNVAELEGQAVFTVLHKSNSPFAVKARNTMVNVLGTTFSVRSYEDESVARVIVAEGKVSANNVVLSGGDVATVSTSGVTVRSDTDVAAELSWTSGRLSFNETPLRDAIRDLNRWYNVDIKLASSSLGALPVTGSFPEGSSSTLPSILELILDARAEVNGRVITIHTR